MGSDFWEGFDVERGNPNNGWLDSADLVVLPAFVEHKPKRLIEAATYGVPVIASKACGLENIEGVESVAVGNLEDLREKIENALFGEILTQKNTAQTAKIISKTI